ncbi:MAG: zinc-ribbon domain-containing protein [Fusobacterium sp. JB021]|nr:zinc-ribbon domain-containing protein [Fusobacterium sp. JB020]MDP0493839.1 zinc-ribbon domain-containing protein [Fusobacterium sp. JB021]MDP0506511.1 zinc-ribbon domain-containing protein [Fusobacterium sp. JB019]MDP0506532.1 zinc-ribbon domain-containing protein [Fusobacterium sp. JB019]
MFFLMGFGSKENIIENIKFKCVNCINENAKLIERANSFSLFFIPLFKFSKKYFIVCTKCNSIYKLKNESIKNILKTKNVSYDDIEGIVNNGSVCNHCGARVNPQDTYCHKCGNKL